ncbi:Receptor-like protein 12 [Morella rubra]|uniref:Receptor-like protein 12 n=1 Tax=Morella rubra TaxID=262757 RepID=A0A6A1WU34_9ROSI|nr:Receptor-like protein 12 [Morella rubra]
MMALCLLFFRASVVSGECLGDQQSSLLQLKKSLVFTTNLSTKLVHWIEDVDCCLWDGVTCNDGRVTGLDLSDESISNELDGSSSLFRLGYLQKLNLAGNEFNYSQIPYQFEKLKNLSYLNMSNAGFAGQIPIEISRLTGLVTLDLSNTNSFVPLVIESPNLATLVQNLSELMELYLDGVHVSAQGGEWCLALSSSLRKLRVLSMSRCHLSGPLDSSLLTLRFLSIIRLDGNDFSGPVPEFFADFQKLTSLSFKACGLTGKFPEKIFQLPTLRMLDLSSNVLLEGFLPEFPPNGSLENLWLTQTGFSGTLPHSIGNLKMLSTLDLSDCNFNGSIPSTVANLAQLLDELSNVSSYQLRTLTLAKNSLEGSIPASLFSLPSLVTMDLSYNKFSGQVDEFPNISSSPLFYLDLSNNNLEGQIPMSLFDFQGLAYLYLSSNNLSGSFKLNLIQQLINPSELDLSHNELSSIECYQPNSSLLFRSNNSLALKLAYNRLKTFPDCLRSQSNLIELDLSNNQIHGEIPSWIWKLPILTRLNLSGNHLVTMEESFLNSSSLVYLDLSSNQLQGPLPVLASHFSYLDFSGNNFSSTIPANIGSFLAHAFFFSLSKNKLHGSIPASICNGTGLLVLDLSANSLSGSIPQCLMGMCVTLKLLNLGRNHLTGTIFNAFPSLCSLKLLALDGNQLKGELPKSLANCTKLEVLDIGNNHVEDIFPCYLKNISMLRILILRLNKFYGPIGCQEPNATWPMLQIIDISSNNFSGKIPINGFPSWTAMVDAKERDRSEINDLVFYGTTGGPAPYRLPGNRYRDVIKVTLKGLLFDLVKIQTGFTLIDYSCNNFEGPIPEEFGGLKLLYILNLSHNAFTGTIPPSFGKLSQLGSLDLSSNKLTGEIPVQLADGLIFLSVLNLSFNQLVGKIPMVKQFTTFSETSYEGNRGLCGFPLEEKCGVSPPPAFEGTHSNSRNAINWNFFSVELGFIFGFGIVIGPLAFWRRWRIWYFTHIDDICFRIFPQCYLRKEYGRRQVPKNQGRRHYRHIN